MICQGTDQVLQAQMSSRNTLPDADTLQLCDSRACCRDLLRMVVCCFSSAEQTARPSTVTRSQRTDASTGT